MKKKKNGGGLIREDIYAVTGSSGYYEREGFHRVGIVSIADCSSGTSGVACSHFVSRGTAHA